MDAEFCVTIENDVLTKLNNHADSHPNIISLWRAYLKTKRIDYMKAIIDCEEMINNIANNRDVSIDTIALLYALFSNRNNDLNS